MHFFLNKRLIAFVMRKGKKATVRETIGWQETLQGALLEIEEGWAEDHFTFGKVHPLPAWLLTCSPFPPPPHTDPVRPVDDHAKSRDDACTSGKESIPCENVNSPSRMVAFFFTLLGVPFGFGLDDL